MIKQNHILDLRAMPGFYEQIKPQPAPVSTSRQLDGLSPTPVSMAVRPVSGSHKLGKALLMLAVLFILSALTTMALQRHAQPVVTRTNAQLSQTVVAPQAVQTAQTAYVSIFLGIRLHATAAEADDNQLAIIPFNAQVTVIGKLGTWDYVAYQGQNGYVLDAYLSSTPYDPSLAVVPYNAPPAPTPTPAPAAPTPAPTNAPATGFGDGSLLPVNLPVTPTN